MEVYRIGLDNSPPNDELIFVVDDYGEVWEAVEKGVPFEQPEWHFYKCLDGLPEEAVRVEDPRIWGVFPASSWE